jgi:hypothetical protein
LGKRRTNMNEYTYNILDRKKRGEGNGLVEKM